MTSNTAQAVRPVVRSQPLGLGVGVVIGVIVAMAIGIYFGKLWIAVLALILGCACGSIVGRKFRVSRDVKNRVFVALCIVATSVSVIALLWLLRSIALQGYDYLGLDNLSISLVKSFPFVSVEWTELKNFLTSPPSRRPANAGLGPALWGSIWTCAVCGIVALPLGVGTAIFLEEFKPKKRVLRKLHGFVQLNITNLAGVPSIVYGILGLTVFVHMFGLLGNAQQPPVQIGVTRYDQFIDQSGNPLLVKVDSREAPPTALHSGLMALDHNKELVAINVVVANDMGTAANAVPADAIAQRVEHKSSYYLQLPFGRGVLAGGLTLMLVILPIIIISTQEALRAVPDSLREGALATGATRWQMVRRMTLPAAVPGIMTGSILAMSRAIGEAAPILIIAGIVYIAFTPQHLMDDFTVMPLQIYNWASLPKADFHKVAASGIIVLLAVLLTFNGAAIFIRQKFQKPLQ